MYTYKYIYICTILLCIYVYIIYIYATQIVRQLISPLTYCLGGPSSIESAIAQISFYKAQLWNMYSNTPRFGSKNI